MTPVTVFKNKSLDKNFTLVLDYVSRSHPGDLNPFVSAGVFIILGTAFVLGLSVES